jgi:hypothetical protein
MPKVFSGLSLKSTGRRLMLGIAAALLATIIVNVFPAGVHGAVKWYDPAWKFRKVIAVNHTLVTHDLEEFPLLIDLKEDKNLASAALKKGEDILFTDADGITKLSHEIEFYEYTSGRLVAWVNIPLLSAEKDNEIFMYYGNPDSPEQQDPKGTWNKNFSMVQHLEETIGLDYDSTGNANDGVYTGSGQYADGWIDGADRFNGTSNNVKIPHNDTLSFTGDFTLETWVCPASVPQYTRHLVSKDGEYILQINGNFVFFVPGVGDVTSVTKPAKDVWMQVTAVFHRGNGLTPNTLDLWINGELESSFTGYGTPTNTKNALFLASGDGLHYFGGTMDEVRLSDTARPKEFIQTGFNNQSKPEAFYKVGDEEVQVVAPIVRTDEANPVLETTATLRGYLTYDGGEACACRFLWDTEPGLPHPFATPWIYGKTTGQSFSAVISGLSKGTHYYYRAQASNSAGAIPGSILYVLTRPDQPVEGSFTAPVVKDTEISLSWAKGEAAQKTMIRAGTAGYPASYNDGRQVYFDTGTSCIDSGLTPGTTYYYRAWSQVSGSEQWSDTYIEMTVTTLGGGPGVTVGGEVHRIDKLGILMPYIYAGMALLLITIIGSVMLYRYRLVTHR